MKSQSRRRPIPLPSALCFSAAAVCFRFLLSAAAVCFRFLLSAAAVRSFRRRRHS